MEETNNTESPDDALARWRDWQSMTCNETSIRQRADVVERLREHTADRNGRALEDVDARHVDVEDVASFLARKHLSANSRAIYYRHLSCWFGWLHRTGRIGADPMVGLRRPRPKRTLPRPITLDAAGLIFDGADQELRAMMALALYAGLRAHEVAMFRGEQIVGREIDVTGKGDKDAVLPLAPQLALIAAAMPREGWWFPSPRPGREHLTAEWVSKRVQARFRACGIAQGSIHRLRHTGATLIQRHRRDIRVTQRWLRHSSLATTAIYTEVADDDMMDALSGLPPLAS